MKNLKENQITTSNYPYSRFSLDYTLDSLERIGAKKIEFYAVYPHFHIDDVELEDIKVLKEKLKHHHLEVSCITPEQCLYPVNIAAKDVVARLRSLDVFKKTIQFGAELGARTIVALAGYGTLDEDDTYVWTRSIDSMGLLGEFAKAHGMLIVLETSPRAYTTTHNSKDVIRMIEQVGSPAISGMVDTATLGYSGETMEEVVTVLGHHLQHAHIADGIPNGHLMLGEGNLNLTQMIRVLDEVGYSGDLSLEILNDKYMYSPHPAMEQSYNKLIGYLSD